MAMKPDHFFAASSVDIYFTISAASADKESRKKINFLAQMDDGGLKKAATIAGDMNGVLQRCRLKPSEDGKLPSREG